MIHWKIKLKRLAAEPAKHILSTDSKKTLLILQKFIFKYRHKYIQQGNVYI